MLLPLPGSCAVVGPFHGREWEPVRDLLSQDYRCRDPQCCGNLLVLCLFLIWQARHSWYKVTRTCSSKRHANKHLCQGPSWGVHIPSETIFCTSSFSSSCLFSQDSSWERMEQLLAHSQEVWVPKERVIGRGPCSSLMTFGISVPHLPSAQRVQFCSSKLPGPANQQQGTPTLKAWGSSLEVTTPWEESHTAGQVPQAASDLASVPTALTVTPEWPVLKKSKRLLLEALMRRRIAHLRWGLPRRVLESYLLFNLLGSCSLPQAGLRLPGVCAGQELQTQQAKHGEARASTAGKSQIIPPSERKSPKLVTEAGALQTCRPPKSEPTGRSVPPQKPKRNRPPGGAREPHIQEAWLGAELPAPRDPRPAAESGRWCGTESR
ncbi:uncharacterized protein ACOB6Z_001509 [Ctenodactylus gundi]